MAVQFTTEPDIIRPVYSPIVFRVVDTVNVITSYDITLTVNSKESYKRVPPDPDDSLTVDISETLQSQFESEIFTHTALESDYTNGLMSYTIKVVGNYDGGTTEITSTTRYIFNGTEHRHRLFDYNDYILEDVAAGAVKPKILNTWIGAKKTEYDESNLTIQYFEGIFDGDTSGLNQITVTEYKKNGTINTDNITIPYTTTAKIRSLNISAAVLSLNSSLTIDENTRYYVVSSATNRFEPIRVDMSQRLDNFKLFRICYVDLNGATDYFDFKMNHTNSLSITRQEINRISNSRSRSLSFNTKADDKISVYSEAICPGEDKSLKELWTSPIWVSLEDGIKKDIIVENKKPTIREQLYTDIPIYELDFKYADDYVVQKR